VTPPTPHAASPTPRRLLARVRDLMAAADAPQAALNRIVAIVAAEMVAEVCSIYVRRAGDILELFATEGLAREAVHATRLRIGEGIVGDIADKARPLALADAQKHPNFAYRPETGEEAYQSMLGVPVLRSGRVIGVIAVQNRTQRAYGDDEIESLETVAMVLAEMIAGSNLIGRDELKPVDGIGVKPVRLEGVVLNDGPGRGRALLLRPTIAIDRFVADDVAAETERLRSAMTDMHGALDELIASDRMRGGGEHRDIIRTFRLIADDAGWLRKMEDAVASGLTAEAAVQRVQNDIRARMAQIEDPYLRERTHDMDELATRLLGHLTGAAAAPPEVDHDVILFARTMGPAQLLDFPPEHIKGLVLEEGTPTAHVAIVARALDVPVLGQVRGALAAVETGDTVILDADNAQVFLRPGDDVRAAFDASAQARAQRREAYAQLRDQPNVSADGVAVTLSLNAGLLMDMAHVEPLNADGVGLYRTEVPFMVRDTLPKIDEQEKLYARILDTAGGRPVTFRTLDVGGDKVLPYLPGAEEENPAMGWRAVRVALDRPALLRQQIRALIRAADGRGLRIMFPMVADASEIDPLRRLLDMEIAREARYGRATPETLTVGLMLEVPSLLFQLDQVLARVDFLSIGSNDLMQFLFAADRGSTRLAGRYDPLSPAVFRVVRDVVAHAAAAGVPVNVCGEMAGRPLEAMALIGLGVRSLSMAPAAFGPVKTMLRSLPVAALEDYLASLPDNAVGPQREHLRAFARDHAVTL
jgi:phosphotransferase system enzyme I (PtsP)